MSSKASSPDTRQALTPVQWARILAAYLLIPLLLLLLGGDVGWWPAWVFSALILAAGVGGRLWAERRHPGLLAERQTVNHMVGVKGWDRVLSPLMAVSVSFPLVIVAGLDHRYRWSPDFPAGLSGLGLILIAGGYALASWALAENPFFSSMVRIQTERGHVVCDRGPYRIIRHPGYAGNILPLPGLVLALGSVWMLIPAAAALIIAVLRTALEDRTLQAELPGYQAYAQRVRYRLLPGVY